MIKNRDNKGKINIVLPNEKFEVEYDERVNPDLFMISSNGSDGFHKMLINTWDDPYCVYYAGGNTPDNKEEFEKRLFDYLSSKYPEHF